jgi:heptosyltransferase I
METTPTSICVLRLSAIGDCINALALVQLLQRNFPEAEITWIIGKASVSLFEGIPGINFAVYDKKTGIRGMLALRKQLKHKTFDVVLDIQSALRASILSLIAVKGRIKYGFDRERAMDGQRFFTDREVKSPEPPHIHVLDGFIAFAAALGCSDLAPRWDFCLTEAEISRMKGYVTGKTVLLTPCSSKEFKNWTLNGYIEITKYALSRGFNVIIAGGKSAYELEMAENIINGIHVDRERVTNIMGKTSLRDLAALISQVSLVISPDSGPVHIANALNIPVLGLYANHNPARVGPYSFGKYAVSVYEKYLAEEHPGGTQGLKWRTKVQNKFAMHGITTVMVREKFDKILTDFKL